MSYFLKGDVESGARVTKSMKSADGPGLQDIIFVGLSGYAAARLGRAADARQALERLEGLRKTQYVDFFLPVQLCAALDDRRKLMLWLQRGYEERSPFWVYVRFYPFIYADYPQAEAFIKEQ